MTMTFALPSLMTWDGNKITDHNRAALSIAVNRISEDTRMANGTMRRYIVADKRTFSTGWSDLPQSANLTVDGFWGKNEMESYYNNQTAPFTLAIHYGDGTVADYSVYIAKFSAEISKRGAFDFWKVDVELDEV